jgi:hypothetical protein
MNISIKSSLDRPAFKSKQKGVRNLFLVLIGAALLPACRQRDESEVKSFLNRPTSGVVNGKEWSIKHAFIDPSIETPEEEDYVVVLLPYKPKSACPGPGGKNSDRRTVMISAPRNTKLTRLKRGSPRTAVFQFQRHDTQVALAAVRGQIQYTKITSKSLKGKIAATYDSDNWINGSFTAVVCEIGEMQAPRVIQYD